ncbi:hypothetical protein ABIE78_004499 [Sinorhizobium fredii]
MVEMDQPCAMIRDEVVRARKRLNAWSVSGLDAPSPLHRCELSRAKHRSSTGRIRRSGAARGKVRQASGPLGEKDAAIAALLDVALGDQPFQHLGDGRLGHAEALGNIHLTGLPAIFEKVGDKFDIVFDELGAAIVPCLPEAFDPRLGIDQARFAAKDDDLDNLRHIAAVATRAGKRWAVPAANPRLRETALSLAPSFVMLGDELSALSAGFSAMIGSLPGRR